MCREKREEEREKRKGLSFKLLFLLFTSYSLLPLAFSQTLTVLTHDSFAISGEVVAAFTEETGIEVEFLPAGDAGEALNRVILTKGNPLGDVLYGIDNSLLARATDEDVFEPYESPVLDQVAERYRFDPANLVTPIDVGFVNFNYDKGYFAEAGLEPPSTLQDLTDPAYEGLTVLQNPATSSPGLAFMLATIDHFGMDGEDDWLSFWADLRDNDVLVTSGWEDAYYTAFTRYDGDRPIVLSYASSPAAEVMFAEETLDDAPTGNLLCDGCVYQQIEAAGILKGSANVEAAQQFIDFMLSDAFQQDVPPNMFVYPVVEGVALPPEFEEYGQIPTPEQVAEVPSEEIEANLQSWLQQWTQVVEQGRDPAEVQ